MERIYAANARDARNDIDFERHRAVAERMVVPYLVAGLIALAISGVAVLLAIATDQRDSRSIPTSTALSVQSSSQSTSSSAKAAALRGTPELADPLGSLGVGQHQDVEHDDLVRLNPFDLRTSRHLGQCEYGSETDAAFLRILLKVIDKATTTGSSAARATQAGRLRTTPRASGDVTAAGWTDRARGRGMAP
jgi:hypothetical protein